MKIELQLGELRIRLREGRDRACLYWPQWMFEPFVNNCEGPADIDLEVRVARRLPEIPHGRLIFDACHGLWTLHEAGEGYYLETLNTFSRKPLNRGWLDKEYARGEIWTREQRHQQTGRTGWMPSMLINPVVEVCFLTRLAREGGVLMHAAGVVVNGTGLVFPGTSGTGKSTLSDFYLARGKTVLSDERIIIRKVDNRFFLCGTPWFGTSLAVSGQVAPLDSIYFIRHGSDSHRLRRLSSLEISQLFLRQCFLPHWDREAMTKTVEFLGKLAQQVECYDLAFLKDPTIIDYLHEHRQASITAMSA